MLDLVFISAPINHKVKAKVKVEKTLNLNLNLGLLKGLRLRFLG
jgi:hypothetical protein